MLKNLWMDEGGAVLSFELLLLLVITVIGVSVGMVVLRDAVTVAFQNTAAAIADLNPSYGFDGLYYVSLDNTVGATTGTTNATDAAQNYGGILDTVGGQFVINTPDGAIGPNLIVVP